MQTRPLTWLKTRNYRNLELTTGVQLQNLNILIGPNGSGKSNFIAALKFLKSSLTGVVESTRGVTRFEDAIDIFGGKRILDATVKTPANVWLEFAFDNPEYSGVNALEIELHVRDELRGGVSIHKEELRSSRGEDSPTPFYFYRAHNKVKGEAVISIKSDPAALQTKFEKMANIPLNDLLLRDVAELLAESQFAPNLTPLYQERIRLLETIQQWHIYNANDMNLSEIRSFEPKIGPRDQFISTSGTNLSLVLDNLIQADLDFEEILNQSMRSVLPATRRIRSTRVGNTSLNIELYREGVKEPFYLYDLSDGTVRMLCWAVILLSPQLPSLLVIEEPEIGLHVAWLSTLAEWIKQASLRTQVIVSTHSPDLLDKFTDRPENVYVFHPIPNDKSHYQVKQLQKERLRSWLEEGYELGDLYRIGDPVIGGWPW